MFFSTGKDERFAVLGGFAGLFLETILLEGLQLGFFLFQFRCGPPPSSPIHFVAEVSSTRPFDYWKFFFAIFSYLFFLCGWVFSVIFDYLVELVFIIGVEFFPATSLFRLDGLVTFVHRFSKGASP